MRQFQNFADVLGHIAKLEISVGLANAGQSANYGAEPAAVDERDVAEVQHDGAAVVQKPGNVRAQRFAFAAGDDASVAGNDGDATNFTSIE